MDNGIGANDYWVGTRDGSGGGEEGRWVEGYRGSCRGERGGGLSGGWWHQAVGGR